MATAVLKSATTTATELVIGQTLHGRAGSYKLNKLIYEGVWHATKLTGESVVIKSVRHWRLPNERDMLRRFQHRTTHLRPLIDEIESPADPPAIVLRWLDDDVRTASITQRLTKSEVKQVAKGVLKALEVLHEDGYIHTDIKPRNILINYGRELGATRFREVQLADLGGTIHRDSHYAKDGYSMGTEVFRSPEAQLSSPVGPSTDIFSLGATILGLLVGRNYYAFEPDLPEDDPQYSLHVVLKHYRILGPWPVPMAEAADQMTIEVMAYVAAISPQETLRPLGWTKYRGVDEEDRKFLMRILKLDAKDRPSASELLEDEWFHERGVGGYDFEDARVTDDMAAVV